MYGMSEQFCKIAEKHVREYIRAIADQKCSSAYFGRIGYDKLKASSRRGCQERSRVIFILESPHIYEFEFKRMLICKGLAMGTTGRLIATYGGEILSRFRGWDLFVLNAVPFQCSLGMSLALSSMMVKEKVVDEMLEDRATQLYLTGSLEKLMRCNRALIVNAAGGSDHRKEILRNTVQVIMKSVDKYIECPHPSTWYKCSVRSRAVEAFETIVFE